MAKAYKDDEPSVFWFLLLGALVGVGVVAPLLREKRPPRGRCGVCQKQIPHGVAICPYCKTELQWKTTRRAA